MTRFFKSILPAVVIFDHGQAAGQNKKPMGFTDGDGSFDFPETSTEKANGWELAKRCGGAATAGGDKDQRNDIKCPNVLLVNTDDMSWADVSINNPSKVRFHSLLKYHLRYIFKNFIVRYIEYS